MDDRPPGAVPDDATSPAGELRRRIAALSRAIDEHLAVLERHRGTVPPSTESDRTGSPEGEET
ncbi:hypothetical protein [Streptomyces bohaiensis]|uniref:Uncharacterized protein n=1 Tax=Streptomyces bohaiensis TaxID=1431344 RepID=A0ABX1C6B1_9ACTN|nr:hypothetical protein [Streptomyces bohaiensis]NJQ14715.1 hypothetical protein [Streptomyces bohaiensis]